MRVGVILGLEAAVGCFSCEVQFQSVVVIRKCEDERSIAYPAKKT